MNPGDSHLPKRFRCFPDNDDFAAMPALWHLTGRFIPTVLRRGRWWLWWVTLYVNEIEAHAIMRRERTRPDFV